MTFLYDANNRLLVDSVKPALTFVNGWPFTEDGAVAVVETGDIDTWVNGVPLAGQAVRLNKTSPIASALNGLSLTSDAVLETADGLAADDTAAIVSWNQAIPLTATGAVAVSA